MVSKVVYKIKLLFNQATRLILYLLLLSACKQDKNSFKIPDLAKEGENGYIKGELIFSLDNKPTKSSHASTIEETDSGLIVAWFGGSEEKNKDVGIWLSRYLDHQWTTPVEVANGIQNDTLRYPCWNPVLFRSENGSLMLFFKVGPSPEEWWGEMMTSKNQGDTWSKPEKLGYGKLGPLIGPVKNKPVQLSDGTIICPSSTEEKEPDLTWRVHFELTRDLGKTWQVVGPINDGLKFAAIQPSILKYASGKLQALCRTRQQVISQSWSKDGGRTWSEMASTTLPNPNSGIDALTLKDGRQLLVYNHTLLEGKFPSGREMLNVSMSNDGISWGIVLTLESKEGEYSYPAVIQTSDQKVHITYTYNRESIKHVILDPRELKYLNQ